MHQSGKPDCDVSEYYNITMAYMSAAIKRTIYFIVKNIKMAQFYKKKQKNKKQYESELGLLVCWYEEFGGPFPQQNNHLADENYTYQKLFKASGNCQ